MMPRPMKICDTHLCNNLTNGKLCKKCDTERRRRDKKPEYKRFWHTERKYGVDESGFETLWIAFNGRCAICDKRLLQPTNTRGQGLDVVAIDHNHATGNLRGLLCNACNKGIGLLQEDVAILKKAIEYLESCNEKTSVHP